MGSESLKLNEWRKNAQKRAKTQKGIPLRWSYLNFEF